MEVRNKRRGEKESRRAIKQEGLVYNGRGIRCKVGQWEFTSFSFRSLYDMMASLSYRGRLRVRD